MTALLALAQQVVQRAAKPWPIGNREKLSRDLIVGQTGHLTTFASEFGVVTSDQITSLFEHFVFEIAFLGFLESIDQTIEIVFLDRFRVCARVLYMRVSVR